MASALDFDPGNSSYWSERHRGIVFGANYNMHLPQSLQVSQSATQCMMTQKCSSACNTPYDLRRVASYQPPPSYFYSTGKTRASMPTEHWCEIIPKYCTTLGFIPKTKLTYAMPTSWKGVQRNFSNHTWSMDIIAVFKKEAQQRLTDASPNWLQPLQKSIPEALWEKISISQERTQTTSPTMFAPSTLNQRERTSLARKEAKTLTFTSNHGKISSLN